MRADLIEWASDIFVMEQTHKRSLTAKFGSILTGKRLTCLRIADRYDFMQQELIELLKIRVLPLIGEREER